MELSWISKDIQGGMDKFDPHWKGLGSMDESERLSVGWDRRGQNTGCDIEMQPLSPQYFCNLLCRHCKRVLN